jgi:adenosylcobalamin-dependent ribonucleoside-triphosphate reductase
MKYVNRLSESFVKPYYIKPVPWGPIGYITYKRTYARRHNARTEEWVETVARCVNGILAIGGRFTQEEAEKLFDHVFNLRCCFSGRALWQLGTDTVARFGGDSLQNCWTVDVNDPVKPFTFAFDELMLGGGVGFNITPESVFSLPMVRYNPTIQRLDKNDVDFIVPDNREGWVKLLREVLNGFFYTGEDMTYSTSCVRPKGQAIQSFGGYASGSEELVKGISQICGIISTRYKKKLRPIDCLDIMNIIGSIVVSGNVRRSAQIALGSPQDSDFLDAKNWNKQSIPPWRAMSNNSVVCDDIRDLPIEFWEGYNGDGEAYGLVNLEACRNYGRLADGPMYRTDSDICGVNPCAEITLESYEACNLAEIFLPNIHGVQQFMEVVGLMYKVCKTISLLPFCHEQTRNVVARNRRIGIGLTGFMQSVFRYDVENFNVVYQFLEAQDKMYSADLGIRESKKLTTIKPSGTLSLLAGCTPGVHSAFSQYYIRRIRMAANDPLVEMCRKNGHSVEPQLNQDGTKNIDTMVVSFPIRTPPNAVCASEMDAIDQLEAQKWLQTYWSDNSVSATIYYDRCEIGAIRQWLEANYPQVKTCSFLLHSEHGFVQAPMEAITPERYAELSSKIKQFTVIDGGDHELPDSMECGKGGCPIK